MKIKFNKFERVAGMFVGFAIVAGFGTLATIAIKQSWFESRVSYYTEIEKAEGVFPGTKVKISGLKAGRVEEVSLEGDKVRVKLSVLKSFSSRIKKDSEITVSRPFIIGEKIFDITSGSEASPSLEAGSKIPTTHSFDLTELMDPRNIQPHIESLSKFSENMKYLLDAFTEESRSKGLIQMFDDLRPLLKNANIASIEVKKISDQLVKDRNLETVLTNVAYTTSELNKEMDNMVLITRELPQITQNSAEVMKNLAVLTKHMNQLIPAITEIAPELPKASRRAIEAMDEAVVVLKALQKSFLLSGAAEEVRKEEKKRKAKPKEEEEEEDSRWPAFFESGD